MQTKAKSKNASSVLHDSEEPLMCKPQKYKFKFTSEREVSNRKFDPLLTSFYSLAEREVITLPTSNYHSFGFDLYRAANFVATQLSKVHPPHLQDSNLCLGYLYSRF